MDSRKKTILEIIIKEHLKTGSPVGSSGLVQKYKMDISSATIRNEMAELENEGLIIQPYTSAGRVPTEKAYVLYLESLNPRKLNEKEISVLNKALANQDETGLKKVAKELASLSNNAVFFAFHKHDLYYTGISNLFSQPEFSQTELVYNMSAIIDRMDEIINKEFDRIRPGMQVMIGSSNIFSDACSVVLGKFKNRMVGILGPMRMDYERNLALIKYIEDKLK